MAIDFRLTPQQRELQLASRDGSGSRRDGGRVAADGGEAIPCDQAPV
jgi:hypothetical protein